ncbi:MAG: hypothetical protein KC496_21355, partial [Anaerolineae bacterium]|nr:hypothetical protein [Anaerolineae bacterium]
MADDVLRDTPVVGELSEAELYQISGNVVSLFAAANQQRQLRYRRDLVCLLLDGLTAASASRVSGIKPNTLNKYRRETANKFDTLLLQEAAPSGVHRKKRGRSMSEEMRYADACKYMRETFSVAKSGDKSEVFRSTFTRAGSYEQYVLSGGTAGETIFNATWSELNVKQAAHALHDYFSCTVCQAHKQREKQHEARASELQGLLDGGGILDVGERLELETRILSERTEAAIIRTHRLTFETQRNAYAAMRADIERGDIFITADFGTHNVQYTTGGTSQADLPDLVIVAHFLNSNGELVHCYLDCIPLVDQHESKDWYYVQSAIRDLHASGFFTGFTRLIWWSDTGPAHFRTSNTLYFWRQFQRTSGIEVLIHFFAPYHGHSMCDGHIGAISKRLTL